MTAETILLVDDEEDIRDVLSIFLTDMGYRVVTAASGAEALDAFDRQPAPIVLSDIKMPGMDGIDLLEEIKSRSPDTEVIMITGHGDMDLAVKSLKRDATDFITKPIHDEALEVALKRAWDRIGMREQIRAYTENLESLVAEKTERLLAAERMAAVGRAVADIAHTIKNIASGLTGGIYVLGQGIDRDEREYLQQGWEMVRKNVDKIRDLALDLLHFGRAAEIERETADPNTPAVDAVDLMRTRAEERGIGLTSDLDDSLTAFPFDSAAVHRCLLNLLDNAIDACSGREPGDGWVRLTTTPLDGGGVAYTIDDNGAGMDPETRSRIFSGFFTTKGADGTGIGLMMSLKIAEGHGGGIEVDSAEGVGTTVTVRIPAPPPAKNRR